jgi:hypothetical protein
MSQNGTPSPPWDSRPKLAKEEILLLQFGSVSNWESFGFPFRNMSQNETMSLPPKYNTALETEGKSQFGESFSQGGFAFP